MRSSLASPPTPSSCVRWGALLGAGSKLGVLGHCTILELSGASPHLWESAKLINALFAGFQPAQVISTPRPDLPCVPAPRGCSCDAVQAFQPMPPQMRRMQHSVRR